jgi:chromate transporter
MTPVSLSRMAAVYLRAGNLTFGGGDPTMAALQSDLVRNRGWLTADQYGLVYALARITPGTNILAFCAGTGWTMLGGLGSVVGVLAASVPASVVAVLLTAGYDALRTQPRAMAAIGAVLAAAVGMMGVSAWNLLERHLLSRRPQRIVRAVVFAVASFALAYFWRMAPIQVLLAGAVAGFLWQVPEA